MSRKVAILAVLGAAALGLAVALTAQTSARTVRDGVFSSAQAESGARVFESICTSCHEIAEFTGPGAYLEEVQGESLWQTFDFVSSEMPEDDPGSLPPTEYAAVLAYILSVYGLPSGETDLPVDRSSLETITIVRPVLPGS